MDRLFGLDSISSHDKGLELLITVYDPTELAVTESILKGAKIPYITKDRGAGGSMKIIAGYSMFGTDIFVLKEHLETALALFVPEQYLCSDTEQTEENND